jgi:hypothetical protein
MDRRHRRLATLALLSAACFATSARAQDRQGEVVSRANIVLRGTITSSITLAVSGSTNRNGQAMTQVRGVGNQGVIDFGTVGGDRAPATGEQHRVERLGYYLVATLRVGTRFSGGGGRVLLDVQRANPCGTLPDLPCGHPGGLFYAKMASRRPNLAASWPTWNRYPDQRYGRSVFDVPDASYIPGQGNLDALMENGDSIDHQLAVFIPDDLPVGSFSTVVTYTATRL